MITRRFFESCGRSKLLRNALMLLGRSKSVPLNIWAELKKELQQIGKKRKILVGIPLFYLGWEFTGSLPFVCC